MERYDRITGFADEIAQDLSTQIESFGKLGIRYIEMRGVDGKNLIHHDNAKVTEIKKGWMMQVSDSQRLDRP